MSGDDEGTDPGAGSEHQLGVPGSGLDIVVPNVTLVDDDPGVDSQEDADAQGEEEEEPERYGERPKEQGRGRLQRKSSFVNELS